MQKQRNSHPGAEQRNPRKSGSKAHVNGVKQTANLREKPGADFDVGDFQGKKHASH